MITGYIWCLDIPQQIFQGEKEEPTGRAGDICIYRSTEFVSQHRDSFSRSRAALRKQPLFRQSVQQRLFVPRARRQIPRAPLGLGIEVKLRLQLNIDRGRSKTPGASADRASRRQPPHGGEIETASQTVPWSFAQKGAVDTTTTRPPSIGLGWPE